MVPWEDVDDKYRTSSRKQIVQRLTIVDIRNNGNMIPSNLFVLKLGNANAIFDH